MSQERRHFTRVLFEAPALLITGSGTHAVQVLDLSLKGALLQTGTPAPLPCGAPCQLVVPLATSGHHIAMAAEVAHASHLQMGLVCCTMDLDSVTHLRRLMELQLGDPALLERDLGALTADRTAPPPLHRA